MQLRRRLGRHTRDAHAVFLVHEPAGTEFVDDNPDAFGRIMLVRDTGVDIGLVGLPEMEHQLLRAGRANDPERRLP